MWNTSVFWLIVTWRYHIDYISSKISKGVGIIDRLRHFVPTSTLLEIYRSLIEPYISYGLIAWEQAANLILNKILILQKRALRVNVLFWQESSYAIPRQVWYFASKYAVLWYSAILMHDISDYQAPSKISELFVRSNMIHSHYTRFSAAGNFYVQRSRLNQVLLSFSRGGVRVWNKIPLTLRETLSSVNYINYWSRFWRLRRCMLIWVPLPVPTWTPYSVKVFSFLINIGGTFYSFIYLFIYLFITLYFCFLFTYLLLPTL